MKTFDFLRRRKHISHRRADRHMIGIQPLGRSILKVHCLISFDIKFQHIIYCVSAFVDVTS